ncbi:hypothetical protein L208DRAFT_878472 [Tricholoma matsutake]|nr:hypothetical protein L208DRAFT_878472 [Tricholoma matsutake 945]
MQGGDSSVQGGLWRRVHPSCASPLLPQENWWGCWLVMVAWSGVPICLLFFFVRRCRTAWGQCDIS